MSVSAPDKTTINRLQHILKTEFILSMDLDEKYIEFLQASLEDNCSFIYSYSDKREDVKFAPIVAEREMAAYNINPSEEEISMEWGNFITVNSYY
ncbi:hypothetical protein ACTXGU_00040 [Niallia sp. 01092]|uniref:hypothetical protein n=1 Tax=Niallia sp. 01092 TaxID=3457759 RepID=UPI003FD2611C